MATLFKPALTDEAERPTDRVLHAHLREAGASWEALWRRVHGAHPQFDEEWRYYRDGASWLLKVTHGRRTICWVSVGEAGFRLTVYFPARAEQVILDSSLPEALKRQFLESPSARTRGLTLVFPDGLDAGLDAGRGAGLDVVEELLTLRDGFR